jgi:hypothetical protein
VTGQQINSALGQVSTVAGSVVSLTGQSVTIGLGTPLVWGEIVPGQDPDYNVIDTSQSPGYSPIDTSQDAGYDQIEAGRDAA